MNPTASIRNSKNPYILYKSTRNTLELNIIAWGFINLDGLRYSPHAYIVRRIDGHPSAS